MVHTLHDWPITVDTILQLMWDLPSASLGFCPCARSVHVPEGVRTFCGYGYLACFACQLTLGARRPPRITRAHSRSPRRPQFIAICNDDNY